MAASPTKSVLLYGGALQVSLPSNFADVSDIRQVPDHQEVWLDSLGFTSVVFDILERVELPISSSFSSFSTATPELPSNPDAEALKYHLHDIVASDGSSDARLVSVISVAQITFPKFASGTKAYGLLAEVPRAEKMVGRPNEPDFVAMYLMVVRLEAQATDLVVGVNVPHVVGTQGYGKPDEVDLRARKMGPLMELAEKARDMVVETLEVKDWSLFVQD
nr:putative ran guanine nucleotide release factor [Quercus suber]